MARPEPGRPGDTSSCQEWKLRPIAPADIATLAEFETENFGAEAWSTSDLQAELTAPYRYYVLAEKDGKIAGYAGARLLIEAEIMTIGVRPSFRSQGLGRLLLNHLIAAAKTAQAETLFLEVRQSNQAAQNLYKSAGFLPVGTIKGYYRRPPEDAQIWRLDLHATSA